METLEKEDTAVAWSFVQTEEAPSHAKQYRPCPQSKSDVQGLEVCRATGNCAMIVMTKDIYEHFVYSIQRGL